MGAWNFSCPKYETFDPNCSMEQAVDRVHDPSIGSEIESGRSECDCHFMVCSCTFPRGTPFLSSVLEIVL